MRGRMVSAAAISSIGALLLTSTALAGGPVLVSASASVGSPYAGCLAKQPAQTGRNYLDAEVEPQIAVNPKNPKNIIGQWHQDRWSNGGARGIAGAFTKDGGQNWTDTTVPYSDCAPGGLAYERASDPWVSFGHDGTAYSSALSFDGSTNRNAVSAASSHDGGKTWGNQQTIVAYPNAQFFTDKNSTTADPVHDGVAYTVWDTLISPTDNPDDHIHAAAYTGPAQFSKTIDGGGSWSAPQTIIGTGNRQQTIGNIIVVDPGTDTLYDFTDLIVPPNTPFQGVQSMTEVAFVKSTDQGATWSAPQVIAPFNSTGTIDPNTGQAARTGGILPEVAIDPSDGTLYVVWQASTNFAKNLKQGAGSFDNEVLFTSSTDHGSSWSTPTAIVGPATYPVFTPMIAVNSTGTVAVTYYDSRELTATNTTTWPTDYWVTYLKKGAPRFGNEQHVSGPFNMMSAPVARGFFLGDYEGLAAVGTSFEALFVQTNCAGFDSTSPECAAASSSTAPTSNTNPTDVFSATLTPTP
jgi:hypothetical protein